MPVVNPATAHSWDELNLRRRALVTVLAMGVETTPNFFRVDLDPAAEFIVAKPP